MTPADSAPELTLTGLNVKLVRYQGDTITLSDALGTGKLGLSVRTR